MSDRYGYIAIEALLNFCENSKDHTVTPNDFMRMARVQVPERKTGRWLLRKGGSGTCSKCRHTQIAIWDADNWQNFCGVCGAKMVGVEI